MKSTRSAGFVRSMVTFALATVVAGGCVVHTGRRADVVYVARPYGGGPVHGAVHGVHCLEHAATLRGCD